MDAEVPRGLVMNALALISLGTIFRDDLLPNTLL